MLLTEANSRIETLSGKIGGIGTQDIPDDRPLFVGVDIGTANIATVVLNTDGNPLDGELTPAKVVKEGMVVDYFRAIQMLETQLNILQERLQVPLSYAASAVPPGTESGNGRVTRNILEAAGLEVVSIIDEPTAASIALGISDGAVVDVGGGTTGISILKNGKVVSTADEATGGFHFDLVIAGRFGISVEEAELMKKDPTQQKKLYPVVRPVMEKVAAITRKYIANYEVDTIYLVGGACSFPGFVKLMEKELMRRVTLPSFPLLVTPLGIAMACCRIAMNYKKGA